MDSHVRMTQPGGMSRRLRDDCPCGCDRIELRIPEVEHTGGHVQISKVQDILRQKILKRPDRQFLIEHHILKDTNVAPSLQVYEQSLKKARLADNLNDKLLKRPGPLELVEHNILETDPVLKEVIKDGLIPYEKTSSSYESASLLPCSDEFDELGLLSEPAVPFSDCRGHQNCPSATDGRATYLCNLEQSADSARIPGPETEYNVAFTAAARRLSVVPRTEARPSTIRQDRVDVPEAANLCANVKKRRNGNSSMNNGGRPVGRLKSSLIFHEYRGPPELNQAGCPGEHDDSSNHTKRSVMDTYKVLLHQQQIFLELLHDLQMHEDMSISDRQEGCCNQQRNVPQDGSVFAAGYGFQRSADRFDLTRSLDALGRLRVSDLRDKCRQRGLFVSGTKQDLIKRITRHDALQRNEPFVSSHGETNKTADFNMAGSECSLFAETCENGGTCGISASNMTDKRPDTSHQLGKANGINLYGKSMQRARLRQGLEDVNRQVKAIHDLNFAELFAAVDAASSAGRWSSGFENLFTMAQQEPTAGCYVDDHSV